jgi:cytochrome c
MLLSAVVYAAAMASVASGRSILVLSKTAGFRHDSIPVAREAILDIGIQRGWSVTFTEDATMIEANRLKAFDAVVFLSTTGKILDSNQEKALIGFIHHGGGFAGIHAAADCEYDWPWYGQLVGAFFLQHPAQQEAVVKIEDTASPITQGLPNPWTRKDEWYDYRTNPRANVHVLASLVPTSYTGSKMPDDHPIMWQHEFEGGRSWYTGMGHTQESYKDPLFLKMIGEGIDWACGASKR